MTHDTTFPTIETHMASVASLLSTMPPESGAAAAIITRPTLVPPATIFPAADNLRAFRDLTPPDPDWVIEGLEPGDVGVITAPGAAGKSMFCLNLAVAVASGQPLFGIWQVSKPGDVLYLYAEDSVESMHRRFHALCQLESISDPVIDRLTFINVRSNPPKFAIRGMQGLVMRQQDVLGGLDQVLSTMIQPRLIILDPMLKFHALEENANNEMNQFLEILGSVAAQAHCAVIFVHHVSKGSDTKHQESARGATAIVNEARWQVALSRLDAKALKRYDIPETDAWRFLEASTPKINGAAQLPTLLLERMRGGVLQFSLKTAGVASPQATVPVALPQEGESNGNNKEASDDDDWWGQ